MAEAEARDLAQQYITPFDLTWAPLLKAALVKIADMKYLKEKVNTMNLILVGAGQEDGLLIYYLLDLKSVNSIICLIV